MSELHADKLYNNNLKSRKPFVSTTNINKSIDHFKSNDMKHNTFEVVNDNDRQSRVKYASKDKLRKQRHYLFLAQE